MAVKKIKMRPEGGNDYADVLHPETTASQVIEEADKKFMTDAERTKLAGVEDGAEVNVVTSVASKTGDVTLGNSDVGLGNVTNDKQMPEAGGTFTGISKAQNNTSYTTAQLRNVILSTSDPSGGSNGDIWIKYE